MQDYAAKLSDFGLAKEGPKGDDPHVTTRVMGTHGYAAPEYILTGHLTAKSDVYSFGVVLLEMLSGRRALDKNRPSGEHNLVEWARPHLSKRQISRILDARLGGQYSLGSAQKAAALVLKCISVDPKARPRMEQVVVALEQLEDALRRGYLLVNSCQDRSYLYLLAMGWNIVYRFRTAQTEIDNYLRLVPLITLVDNARVRVGNLSPLPNLIVSLADRV